MAEEAAENAPYFPLQPTPSLAARLRNYVKLVFSRNPVQLHRSFRQSQSLSFSQDESSRGLQPPAARFQAAAERIVDAVSIRANISAVEEARGADRLAAAAELSLRLEEHPHRNVILKALQKKSDRSYTGFRDHLLNELYLVGQKVFDLFTPSALNTHSPCFTAVFTLVVFVTFFFMAAEFPRYQENLGFTSSMRLGPKALIDWIVKSSSATFKFSTEYLWAWGGRYAPTMENGQEVSRWFTSLLLHVDFGHLMSNMILFVLFATHLEHKYGTWRIGFLILLAGLGGNLLSAAFEVGCILVVGASGCCFGLLGLFVADMALNFETITFPILRAIVIVVLVILNLYSGFTTENTSNLSHLGGFVTGLFPSFLLLPNLKWEKYEASFPYLGGVTLLFFFIILPLYLYLVRFPREDCPIG